MQDNMDSQTFLPDSHQDLEIRSFIAKSFHSDSSCILLVISCAADALLFCLASRSRFIAPNLVHAVR